MKSKHSLILYLFTFLTFSLFATEKNDYYNIYIDADYSNHYESSFSIEKGLNVAFKNSNFKILNKKIKIIRKDHRGNSARCERHIKQYLNDPNALAMVSGIHSPPLLASRKMINENNVLFLVPWAAAGPITRYPSEKNSIFRLSVDDSKAGVVIVNFAVKQKKYKKPFLLLENTGWGKSNKKTMSATLEKLGISNYIISWYDWGLKSSGAKSIISNALKANCDVIILVGNAIEGKVICNAAASLPDNKRLPMLSHWGIIGGNFHKLVLHENREKIDLHFIQTKFSFMNNNLNSFAKNVFSSAQNLYPQIKQKKDILAPTGFIHAHDLGLLLLEAGNQIESKGKNIQSIRIAMKESLESLKKPVQGLIKTYKTPFSIYSDNNKDAHEALGIDDFKMAKFGKSDEILLVP